MIEARTALNSMATADFSTLPPSALYRAMKLADRRRMLCTSASFEA